MKKMALKACNQSSLAGYLKALGAFKVLAEQLEPDIRLYWDGLTPYLCFHQERSFDDVIDFFLNRYEPTPIVIPWSGNDFFTVNRAGDSGPFRKPPSKGKIIEAFIASDTPRLEKYRCTLGETLDIIEELGLSKKDIEGSSSSTKKRKAQFMGVLRSRLTDEMVELLDVAAAIEEGKVFTNTLLGSGGGNDGNLHFGSNYMQCLWLCLPDFSAQQNLSGNYKGFNSKASITESLFGENSGKNTTIIDDSIGLYASGYVGGPNAHEGFEAKALRNPWDLILNLEGVTLFKGALSSRSGSKSRRRRAVFPFTSRVSFDALSTIVSKEIGQKELWLPVWSSPVSIKSLEMVFSEGRAEVGGRQARDGVDFMRAIASLGVDRGINAFQRYGIIKGRVGGDNYHSAINLGVVKTFEKPLENVDLFNDIDGWLNLLRRACSQESIANRYILHLRNIESAISAYCRQGDRKKLQEVLLCLGRAEQAIARASSEKPVPPLRLTPRWIKACADSSTEYRLACAISSITDKNIGPIRVQIEPVEWENDRKPIKWSTNDNSVCWGMGELSNNLSAVLQRRTLEGSRKKSKFVPISSKISLALVDVYRFLKGNVDERKINDLVWAMSTVKWHSYRKELHAPEQIWRSVPELPRVYSLLKLIYLPRRITYSFDNSRWEYSFGSAGTRVSYVHEIFNLLKAGRIQEVNKKAVQRLVSSGLKPIGAGRGETLHMKPLEYKRLAASLLIPVWEIDTLAKSVLFPPPSPHQQ